MYYNLSSSWSEVPAPFSFPLTFRTSACHSVLSSALSPILLKLFSAPSCSGSTYSSFVIQFWAQYYLFTPWYNRSRWAFTALYSKIKLYKPLNKYVLNFIKHSLLIYSVYVGPDLRTGNFFEYFFLSTLKQIPGNVNEKVSGFHQLS